MSPILKQRMKDGKISEIKEIKFHKLVIKSIQHLNKYRSSGKSREIIGPLKLSSRSIGNLVFKELKCRICYKMIRPGEDSVRCVHCQMGFHKNHWDSWVNRYHRCPYCRANV